MQSISFRRSALALAVHLAGGICHQAAAEPASTLDVTGFSQKTPDTDRRDADRLDVKGRQTDVHSDESHDDATTLAAVTVVGTERKSTILPKRPVRSIYGTASTVLDTPRAVSEVNAQQLAQDVIKSADDLVRYAPSITRGGGQNANFAPQIRAQSSEVLQDGQRTYNVRHPSNFNAYEGADIVAGPTGVIYGASSNSGGYINYLTKKPKFDQQQTILAGTLGSWYQGKGVESNYSLSVDTTGPLRDDLAYRFSATAQKQDDYYDHVKNNYNALYAALAWRPSDKLRLDWNISYDDYYDFNVTHGWNRASQQSVDSGLYYAGRATPIIQTGTSFWSPVYESGAAHSRVIGWQQRVANSSNQYIATGAVQTTPLPNATAASAGRIRGWVYDPTLSGNGLVPLDDQISGRAEDKNSAQRLSTQLKVNADLSRHWSILNSTIYQKNPDKGDSVGSFFTDLDYELFDNRLEFQGDHDFSIFGLKVNNKSNTGASYRHESFTSLAANNSFNINPYDLTQNISSKNPGDLLGLINNTGSTGGWIGAANVPQYSQYFGYLNLPAMFSLGNGLYAERGGFPTSGGAVYTGAGFWDTTSVFNQQNLLINEVIGVNLGINHSAIKAKLKNPLVLNPSQAAEDSRSYSMLSYQGSVYVKPVERATLYATYDDSKAINTGVFGPYLVWGAGNKLNPQAFDSGSTLKEIGAKFELVPDALFLSLSRYWQSRDTSPDTNGNMAQLKVDGVETSLRWQPRQNLSVGANLTQIDARYTSIIPAGFSPFGFYADNATVWGDNNALNRRTAGWYDAAGIPEYSASAYVNYQLESGYGANLSGWWSSEWYTNLSKTVKIPDEYNLDLSLYYRQPQWSVGINFLNLTNERNFVNGLSGSNSEFLQVMRPFTVQGQFSYKF